MSTNSILPKTSSNFHTSFNPLLSISSSRFLPRPLLGASTSPLPTSTRSVDRCRRCRQGDVDDVDLGGVEEGEDRVGNGALSHYSNKEWNGSCYRALKSICSFFVVCGSLFNFTEEKTKKSKKMMMRCHKKGHLCVM